MTQLTLDEKMDRIRRNWHLEDVPEVPFLVEIGFHHVAYTKYFNSDWEELTWNEDYQKKREGLYDYGMPNIKPNLGIGIVAASFGCEQVVNDEADPWIKPLIREENVKDVYALEVPDPASHPVYKRAWERVELFQTHSDLPLRLVNVPSPLVTGSLIWEYSSFLTAMLIHPKEVHALMEKITVATIDYIRAQLRKIKNLFTMGHQSWYIPRDLGVRISDDTAAVMSPNLYREFGVKYNSLISRAFGGLVVHSCGDVQNVVEPMMEIEGLRGLDLTIPNNPNWEVIRKAAAGKIALNLRHYYLDHKKGVQVDLAEYSKKIINFFGRKGIFIQTSTPTPEEAVRLGADLHRVLSK